LRIDDKPLTSNNIQTWLTQTENHVEFTAFINMDRATNRTFRSLLIYVKLGFEGFEYPFAPYKLMSCVVLVVLDVHWVSPYE